VVGTLDPKRSSLTSRHHLSQPTTREMLAILFVSSRLPLVTFMSKASSTEVRSRFVAKREELLILPMVVTPQI